MSDSSDDESKELNSEVTSSCSDNQRALPQDGGESTSEDPKPRSLSPDTSEAVAPEDQPGPSQALTSVSQAAVSEILTSTTGSGSRLPQQSLEEDASSDPSSQQAVSSAIVDKEKSSSSDEYFEADASPFQRVSSRPGDVATQGSSNVGSGSNWDLEVSSESNSQDASATTSGRPEQPSVSGSSSSATLKMPQKSWEMLMSYESSSDEGEAESSNQLPSGPPRPQVSGSQHVEGTEAATSGSAVSEGREISTTQQQGNNPTEESSGSNNEHMLHSAVTSGLEVGESASSSGSHPEVATVSGSQDTGVGQGVEADTETPSHSGEIAAQAEQVLTSSSLTSHEADVTESRRLSREIESNQQLSSSQQPLDSQDEDMEEEEEVAVESALTSSGLTQYQEAEAIDQEAGPSSEVRSASAVSGSDDLNMEQAPVEVLSSSQSVDQGSDHGEVCQAGPSSNLEPQPNVSGSNDALDQEVGLSSSLPAGPRADSPSTNRGAQETAPNSTRSSEAEVDLSSSSSGPSVSQSREVSRPPSASSASPANQAVSASPDDGPGSAQLSVSSASRRPRPQEQPRMSVLAQQLSVSSASSRTPMLRQLMGAGQRGHGIVGPDSTTMEQNQSEAGEEVSTTEEEQPGQVSTSQQRVVSTSWPSNVPSRVSSSVDSSAGHISTSIHLGGLLASRLARDPVSTSDNIAPLSRDQDLREGGASSTTSGLRGLLSSAPRPPIGVTSSRNHSARSSFDQSSSPNLAAALQASTSRNFDVTIEPSAIGSSLSNQMSFMSQPSSSTSQSSDQLRTMHGEPSQSAGTSRGLATAPGDKFPHHDNSGKPKKRRRTNDEPPPLRPIHPGPSREPPPSSNLNDSNSSLVEQLRKAGVIVTPVVQPPPPPQASGSRRSSNEARNNDTESHYQSGLSSLPSYITVSKVNDHIDSSSSDDIQVLSLFGKETAEPPPSTAGPSMVQVIEGTEDSSTHDGEFIILDPESQELPPLKRRGRKRGPRKPVEITPEMLRPKRPRRAKEKPDPEEEKKEEKPEKPEKQKPGRKKKKGGEVETQATTDIPQPEVQEAPPPVPPTPPKTKAKERKTKAVVVAEPPTRPQDEDTRMSASADDSQMSQPSRPPPSADATPKKRLGILPEMPEVNADSLVEYQWPLNDRLADSYMIQEQVAHYLGIKSFKRKYPDLKRRQVELEEREFLQERGLVSEAMCDLGLTAVQSAEVLDIMSADFQEKYEEYRRAVRERHIREMAGKQKAASAFSGDKGLKIDPKSRAMQSAAKWNASFNRDRRDERRCCCDLQTMSVQFPQSRRKYMTKETPKLGTYPVALIPGQFTDHYKKYTPTELRYLPLNTVMYGPMRPNEQHEEQGSEGSPSDSEDSSSSDESSSSSSSDGTQDTEETGSTAAEPEQDIPATSASTGPLFDQKCKVCVLPGSTADSMVMCAQCNSYGHLVCLGLTVEMLPHIRRYAWQCTDCKTCIQCKDPADEDKMLFCDLCDRGYHIYCVGLRKVPEGRWHCQECSVCNSCGTLDPAGSEAIPNSPPATPDKTPAQWQHEFKRGEKGARVYAQTLCVPCSRLWRRGSYCQLCLRCYRKPDPAIMLSCSVCDKWMHAECCSLSAGMDLAKIASNFVCEICQEASQVRANAPPTTPRIIKVAARV